MIIHVEISIEKKIMKLIMKEKENRAGFE